MDRLQFFALLIPALGSFVLVILAWINSNVRAARLEAGQDQLRAEIGQVETRLRQEITQLRSEVSALRDLIYREMVSLHERIANVEARNS